MVETTKIDAVATALSLVELLAESPSPMRIKELSEQLKTTPSKTYRHLSTLKMLGYLEQESTSGRYYLTAKLMHLGHSVAKQSDFLSVSRKVLPRLHHMSGLAVSVGVIEENGVRVIDIYQQKTSVEITTWPGALFSFDDSAHGKVAIAFGLVSRKAGVLGTRIKSQARLSNLSSEELEVIRINGWADAPNAVLSRINAVAAPVFDAAGLAGTISIIGGMDQLPTPPRPDQVTALTEAAASISWQLGGEERYTA